MSSPATLKGQKYLRVSKLTHRSFINYVGQLRFYSYSDLLLMFIWLDADFKQIVSCSLLWFGFLVYLESVHKDNGRSRWHWSIWLSSWIAGVVLLPNWFQLLFFVAAVFYALKKYPRIGWASPLFNGLVKATLILTFPNGSKTSVAIVFAVMAIRNLVGDFRDAGKDFKEGIKTMPILFHYKHNTPLVYPLCLGLTSALWTWLGGLPWYALAISWAVQALTYNWTPR